MYLQWTEELEVGIEELDNQHKNVFKAVNEMVEAMSKGRGHKKYFSLLKFLETYIDEHFTLEEVYMTRFGYGDYEEHKKEHEAFRKKFSEFKQQFAEEGSTARLVVKTQNWLHEWLMDHLLNTDKKYVEFLKPKLEEERSRAG